MPIKKLLKSQFNPTMRKQDIDGLEDLLYKAAYLIILSSGYFAIDYNSSTLVFLVWMIVLILHTAYINKIIFYIRKKTTFKLLGEFKVKSNFNTKEIIISILLSPAIILLITLLDYLSNNEWINQNIIANKFEWWFISFMIITNIWGYLKTRLIRYLLISLSTLLIIPTITYYIHDESSQLHWFTLLLGLVFFINGIINFGLMYYKTKKIKTNS